MAQPEQLGQREAETRRRLTEVITLARREMAAWKMVEPTAREAYEPTEASIEAYRVAKARLFDAEDIAGRMFGNIVERLVIGGCCKATFNFRRCAVTYGLRRCLGELVAIIDDLLSDPAPLPARFNIDASVLKMAELRAKNTALTMSEIIECTEACQSASKIDPP